MSITRISLAVPATLGALLLLAGCTASGSTPDPAPSTGDSPLTPYLTAIYGVGVDPNADSAALTEQREKSETLVAACMKEKGFDYVPAVGGAAAAAATEYKPDDRDWVSQNGYGLSRAAGSASDPDPNADYVASLTESERDAYLEALWGMLAGGDTTEEFDPAKAGCQGAAMVESGTLAPLGSDEFADLRTAIQDLYANIGDLPEQQKADSDWSSCMAEAGHPDLKTQSDGLTSVSERLNEAAGDGSGTLDSATAEQLRKTEIDTALADLDCRTKTDYAERSKRARWAVEEKFVADHRAELEAAKAAAEQARS
ncbi:hypothetical protein [Microbacterium sp. SLBN-111]|uniref:hypothetical protein n=1 Tax=Microbacterium sp. SLBN-111 TaxID=3377733 RepID=UPI003C74FF08